MPDHSLTGRIAVVTGGESGIGAACVTALAAAGADVAVAYHNDAAGAGAGVSNARAQGRRAVSVSIDITDEASVADGFDAAEKTLGKPDILVHCAGVNMSGVHVADLTFDDWQRIVGADLTGAFLVCRRFLRGLGDEHRHAAIINVTSIHSFAMRAGGAAYGAAKGGQANLTRTLALETAARGITVNAIAPGMILTPMNAEAVADEAVRREREGHIPAGRAGRADEVADLAVFLASPAASYITGAEIVIDGGLSLVQAVGA